MTKTNDKTAASPEDLIRLGAFTAETKGPALHDFSDGVMGQFRLAPGLAAD